MKRLTDRQEIARAINRDRKTVVRVDLADADCYGLKSQIVMIDCGTFDDGTPYLKKAELRAYCDEMKFTFSSWGACLTAEFGYTDIEEMLVCANAPVIKPDSDVVICVVDSAKRTAYAPVVLHTGKRVDRHCSTPLTFVDKDNDALPYFLQVDNKEVREHWAKMWKFHGVDIVNRVLAGY